MHNKFAVCGKALLPGKIAPVVVGHVTKELSRHIWFAIYESVKAIEAEETDSGDKMNDDDDDVVLLYFLL